MAEHKGTITLIIVALVMFGILVAFAVGVFDPLMQKIGTKFNEMVDDVFNSGHIKSGIGESGSNLYEGANGGSKTP